MYFEPITSLFRRSKEEGREQLLLVENTCPPESFDENTTGMRRRALVVEDDAATRHMLVDLIASNEIDVDWAADGEEAIAYLSRRSYDVVVLDLILPKISGMDIMEHLECTQPQTLATIIVVTGVDVSEVRRLFPGIRDALAKPVIPSRLLRSLQTCIPPAEERKQTA
jgi:DNA-binding response OmpR family regulator